VNGSKRGWVNTDILQEDSAAASQGGEMNTDFTLCKMDRCQFDSSQLVRVYLYSKMLSTSNHTD